jgi:hypothetical protein
MSSRYAAEPIPQSIDATLAEYLSRQLNAIEIAMRSDFQAPKLTKLPERKVIGAVVLVRNQEDPSEDGFFACIENSQGEGEWKRLVLTDP